MFVVTVLAFRARISTWEEFECRSKSLRGLGDGPASKFDSLFGRVEVDFDSSLREFRRPLYQP